MACKGLSRSMAGGFGAVIFSTLLTAQTARPTFEVASVKRNVSERAGGAQLQPGGRFVATNQSLVNLILFAYGIVEPQLVDGPPWIKTLRFDINAKPAGDIPEPQVRLALQSLLEDRFRLVIRKEQREMGVQEIVRNRDDGRLGAGMVEVPSIQECRSAATQVQKNQIPAGAIVARFAQCGLPSPILTGMVYSNLGTLAVDKTGLTGMWFISVYFTPQSPSSARTVEIDPNLPSFITAFQDQLGLKIRSTRAMVDALSIVSVQQPTEN